jgi:hypothetical protein
MALKIVGACRKCGEPVQEDRKGSRSCRNGCDQFTAAPRGDALLSISTPDYRNGVEGAASFHFIAKPKLDD